VGNGEKAMGNRRVRIEMRNDCKYCHRIYGSTFTFHCCSVIAREMYTKCGHREVCPRAAITFFWV